MEKRTYATEGIILARRNIGEADRLLTVFTKHYGRLHVVAKGVRRTTSRKRGSLELFSQVKLFLAKGKTFDIITEVETKDNFNAWRRDLLRVGIAYHLAEIVNRLTQDGQEHKKVYNLLEGAYKSLENLEFGQIARFINNFKTEVLIELGFLNREKRLGDPDGYIENLIQSKLKTKRFLKVIV